LFGDGRFLRLSALPKVVIQEGPGAGKEFEVEQAAILGRLDTNDIPVHDKKASREHAKIYKQGDRFAIVDLNSSNGTFVNGEKITKRILEPGDRIEIGVVRLVFQDPEAEAAKAAASQRKSLDEAFETAQRGEPGGAAAAATATKPADVQMRGHKPIQVKKIKPGNPLLGIDLDQLSDVGRVVVYLVLLLVFAGLMYLAYSLVAP